MARHLALLAALITGSAVAAPAAALPLSAPAKVRLTECRAAVDQSDRVAIFESEMKPVAGAVRMQVRFTLQARTPDRAGWTRVSAAGFGSWISATPGVRRFVYTKRVENLFAPAQYRVSAKFRWLSSAGVVLDRERRRSPVCRQPDQRADLTAMRIDVAPGSSRDARTYVIPVVNEGNVHAAGFALRLTVNGQAQPLMSVPGLAAGERTLLSLEAPVCRPGTTLTAVVDAEGVIDEADEADNTLTASCPSEA